jgi:hypothetical protein
MSEDLTTSSLEAEVMIETFDVVADILYGEIPRPPDFERHFVDIEERRRLISGWVKPESPAGLFLDAAMKARWAAEHTRDAGYVEEQNRNSRYWRGVMCGASDDS